MKHPAVYIKVSTYTSGKKITLGDPKQPLKLFLTQFLWLRTLFFFAAG